MSIANYRHEASVDWCITPVRRNAITGKTVRLFDADCTVQVAYNDADDWEAEGFSFDDGRTVTGRTSFYTIEEDDPMFAVLLREFRAGDMDKFGQRLADEIRLSIEDEKAAAAELRMEDRWRA